MEKFLASLHITMPSGFTLVPSLPHIFLIFTFILCSVMIIFLGVLLKRAIPCIYFGLFCAFLSMQNVLPIFAGEAMWIPVLMIPGCISGMLLYALMSFVLWLIDVETGEMTDGGKRILAGLSVGTGSILLAMFLYVIFTHNFFIIFLICATLAVLGFLNQNKIIANGHRFKAYPELYDLKIDEYAMKTQNDFDHLGMTSRQKRANADVCSLCPGSVNGGGHG